METTRRGFLAGAVAPAIVGSAIGGTTRDRRLREAGEEVERGALTRDEIPTPALMLDLDAFEWNIAKMAAYLRERGRSVSAARKNAQVSRGGEGARPRGRGGCLRG